MNSFKMENRDLTILNGDISIVNGNECIAQILQSVLSTNKGEWLFNEDEGIEFKNILGQKELTENIIKSEIEDAIMQVDEELTLETLKWEFDGETRTLMIKFTVKTPNNEIVEVNNITWQ